VTPEPGPEKADETDQRGAIVFAEKVLELLDEVATHPRGG